MNNSYFFHLLQKEREEIDKLKWLESEKLGEDIGIHRAITHWTARHRKDWMEAEIKATFSGDSYYNEQPPSS